MSSAVAAKKINIIGRFFGGAIFLFLGMKYSYRLGYFPWPTLIGAVAAIVLWAGAIADIYRMKNPGSDDSVTAALLQFYVIIGATVLSTISIGGYFFVERAAFWDNRFLYSFFHDNLHSLNRYGEPAWWLPHNQFGMPGYFYSILGDMNCASPIFVAIGVIFWFLGRLGIHVTNILPLYIWYFSTLGPFIFILSVWALARQILRSNVAIIYALILGAFSPALMLNLTDIGFIEISAYGLFFCAAYLKFVKVPSKINFLALLIIAAVLAVSFNYTFLIWNFLFLLLFISITLYIPRGNLRRTLQAFGSLKFKGWVFFCTVVAVCLLVPLITLSQRGDIVKRVIGDSVAYDVRNFLRPGSPLEVLLSGTPGVGLYWHYIEKQYLALIPTFLQDARILYGYLGILALPLAIWGFAHNRSHWRLRLFILFGIFFSIVVFANYSPLFLSILLLPTPLQSNSHFADLTYRSGGFVLLILAAGLGLDFLQQRTKENKFFIVILGVFVLASFFMLVYLEHKIKTAYVIILGLLLMLWVMFSVLLVWLEKDKKSYLNRRTIFALMLLFVFVDVSTICHLHVKKVIAPNLKFEQKNMALAYSDILRPDGIGIISKEANNQADTDLTTASLLKLQANGWPLAELPPYALYRRIKIVRAVQDDDFGAMVSGAYLPVVEQIVERSGSNYNDIKKLLGPEVVSGNMTVTLINRTYNSLNFTFETAESAMLFVRDAYHPYWQAVVNNKDVPIIPVLGHFKAIYIPAGTGTVRLHFEPEKIMTVLVMAYVVIILLIIAWIGEFFKHKPQYNPKQKV